MGFFLHPKDTSLYVCIILFPVWAGIKYRQSKNQIIKIFEYLICLQETCRGVWKPSAGTRAPKF